MSRKVVSMIQFSVLYDHHPLVGFSNYSFSGQTYIIVGKALQKA